MSLHSLSRTVLYCTVTYSPTLSRTFPAIWVCHQTEADGEDHLEEHLRSQQGRRGDQRVTNVFTG